MLAGTFLRNCGIISTAKKKKKSKFTGKCFIIPILNLSYLF